MSNVKKLMMTAAGGDALSVEDLYATHLWRGTGTSNSSTQNIINNIDLAGEGGLVWIKSRDPKDHFLFDTVRGATKYIRSNTTDSESSPAEDDLSAFLSNGFTVRGDNNTNENGIDHVGWTFRKAKNFFDIVTYTGTGSIRTVSHNLGVTPGSIWVKNISRSGEGWRIYHRGMNNGTNPQNYYMMLQSSNTFASSTPTWNDTAPTASVFTVGTETGVNYNGDSYVAYLFAHNDGNGTFGPTGDQDIIKCGNYTGNSGFQEIDIGFEPQWLLVKATDDSNSTYARWAIFDTMRTWAAPPYNAYELNPNTYNNERNGYSNISPSHTGFTLNDGAQQTNSSGKYIYIAIRKGPMRAGDTATNLFGIDNSPTSASGGQPLFTVGFKTDLGVYRRKNTTASWNWVSRPVDRRILISNSTDSAQSSGSDRHTFHNGFTDSATVSDYWGLGWAHSPGFFDSVHYRGTGSSTGTNTFRHNLGVKPEMIWIKRTSASSAWMVWHKDMNYSSGESYTNKAFMNLNETNGVTLSSNYWSYNGNPQMTTTHFSLGSTYSETNNTSSHYVAFLMASLDGISKCGGYAGNGSDDRTIDCGFSSSARMIMIKETTNSGNWWMWDTERGITANNTDPSAAFNTTSSFTALAENQYNSSVGFVEPDSSGFKVSSASQVNGSGRNYIFWAIA